MTNFLKDLIKNAANFIDANEECEFLDPDFAFEIIDDKHTNHIIKWRNDPSNFSFLVELVESGKFLTDEEYCKNIIKEVLEDVFLDNLIDVATLSSTHLPFLEPFLRSIFINVKFLDPAKNISNILKDFAEDNDLQQNVLRIFTSGDVKLFKKNLQMMGIDDEVNFLTI